MSFYRKIHLFDVAIPNGPILMESSYTLPGDKLVMVRNTPLGNLGLSTCYDLRFPELYRELRRMGSEILLVPSAFTIPTGKAHWHTLLKARAIETQCYVIAAAQSGKHNEKRSSYGHSLVIDPWGKIIAEGPGADSHTDLSVSRSSLSSPSSSSSSCSSSSVDMIHGVDEEGSLLLTADINLDYLHQLRSKMPLENHKRYDLFPTNTTNIDCTSNSTSQRIPQSKY